MAGSQRSDSSVGVLVRVRCARVFVRYCRRVDQLPSVGVKTFAEHLAAVDISAGTRSDYRSHARAFVQFLDERHGSRADGVHRPGLVPSRRPVTDEIVAFSPSVGEAGGPGALPSEATNRDLVQAGWLSSLAGATTAELLAGYARTLEILRERQVLRTANAPLGDFTEWLVWRAFGGMIEPNSTKSHDVTDAAGRRLQVKARLVSATPTPGQLQTSVFRSWNFDFAILVQLAERDYSVARASTIPAHVFDEGRTNAKWSDHVRGWAVFMPPALMGHSDATDVTAQLRAASAD